MDEEEKYGKDKLIRFAIFTILSLYSTELALGAGLGVEYSNRQASSHWCWWNVLAVINGVILGTLIRAAIINRYNWF